MNDPPDRGDDSRRSGMQYAHITTGTGMTSTAGAISGEGISSIESAGGTVRPMTEEETSRHKAFSAWATRDKIESDIALHPEDYRDDDED